MREGAKGGTFDPLATIEDENTPLRAWAESLRPTFLDRCAGGLLYGCLFTHVEEGRFMWAFGYGESREAARQQAIPAIMEQRMRSVILIPVI